jgi:hypothetical protein
MNNSVPADIFFSVVFHREIHHLSIRGQTHTGRSPPTCRNRGPATAGGANRQESFMAMTSKTTPSAWESAKPKVMYLVIGLIAGPIITSIAGWQVLSGTARDQVHASVVEQQATFCAANARTEMPDTSKLDYTARNDLAKKWAIMPGTTTAESDVANACARKLAS